MRFQFSILTMLICTAVLAVISAASVTMPVSETIYINRVVQTKPGNSLPSPLLELVPQQVYHSPSGREIIRVCSCGD
jgi:hypothetical protein